MDRKELLVSFLVTFIACFLAISLAMSMHKPKGMPGDPPSGVFPPPPPHMQQQMPAQNQPEQPSGIGEEQLNEEPVPSHE